MRPDARLRRIPLHLAASDLAIGLLARNGQWPVIAELVLLLLAGAGFGAGFSPAMSRVVAQVPADSSHHASGLLTSGIQLSYALGVTTLGSYYLAGQIAHAARAFATTTIVEAGLAVAAALLLCHLHGISASDQANRQPVFNSSTACFWLKQNSQNKAGSGIGRGIQPEDWMNRYEFTATTLRDYPLPVGLPLERARQLDELACELAANAPRAVAAGRPPTLELLATARAASDQLRGRMIAVQEELDWEVYRLYGLIDDDLTYGGDDLPGLELGERAFEIVLARAVKEGEEETAWFARHGSTPITEIPAEWPLGYRDLVQRRLDLIGSDPFIRLLEKPEYKRRWAQESWGKRQELALRDWLLDRLEDRRLWFDAQGRPRRRSIGQLADEVGRDADLVSVLELWEGRPDVPVTQSLVRLLADEAVPFLAAYRYKDSGLRKREAWEQTWALQRREDAGEKVGPIPMPPKYTSADFRRASFWHARGKLDVPKERFILYSDAGRETDPTPLLGWAGWDHAQQSLALSVVITEREKDGWADDLLVPLVAGLAELQPWVQQWHDEVDPEFGISLAAFCREQLTARAAQVGKTAAELTAWRPAAAAHRTPRK